MKAKWPVLATVLATALMVAPAAAALSPASSGPGSSGAGTPASRVATSALQAGADVAAGTLGISVNVLAHTSTTQAEPESVSDPGAVSDPQFVAAPASGAAVSAVEAAAGTSRLAGTDRYGTAVAISQWAFPHSGDAERVYLARADVFADALAAGVLTDGPVLLVPAGCSAPRAVVRAEIERLDPGTVVALGGEVAVCQTQLETAANGRTTGRLAGENRAATAAAVGLYEFAGGASTVYLARGNSSPDAMVGGVLTDGPILLTNPDGTHVPQATHTAIAALDPDRVIALGGTTSVSNDLLVQAAAGRPMSRLAGTDRYSTSVRVAERAFPAGSDRVYIARGDGAHLTDAVASGVLADGPVLLVNGPCIKVPNVIQQYLAGTQPAVVVALGGQGAVCSQLLDDAAAAATPPPPPGPDCAAVRCVALTFDDGPSAYTTQLVDTLDTLGVPATFFVTGQMSSARPNTVKRSFDHGYQIENHTWDHPQLTTLTLTQQRAQFTSTSNLLAGLGIEHTDMLRPPYGAWNANTRNLGVPLILWSIDTRDWENRNTAQIRANVVNAIHNGAIVLQHDTVPESVAAVPGIVSDLQARGYHFVTVEDLVPWAGPGDLVYSRGKVIDGSVVAEVEVRDGADYVSPVDAAQMPVE